MKNFKSISVLLLLTLTVFFSCKEKEGDKVTFALAPVEVSYLNENAVDSINTTDTLLIDTLIINNDFFRSACDVNNVYLDDVESVSIVTASLNITDPAGFDINDYKSVSIYLKEPGYSEQLHIAQSKPVSAGSTFYFDLKNSTSLLKYFKLYNLPVYAVVSRSNHATSNTTLKLRMQFEVTGVNH